jgi:hypothetical protein
MTDKNPIHQDADPQIVKLIGLLRPTPPRDPQVVQQNRLKFLAEVDNLIGAEGLPSRKKKFYPFHFKEKTSMNVNKPKFALTVAFVIVTIFVFLFGGTGLTVLAAQSSLPGDALYTVKTRLEQTRLSLTAEDDRVAQLHLSLAQKRLDEIKGLIREGRLDLVAQTAAEFERQIQLAVEALKRLAENDPARAGELTTQMMAELSIYTKALTGMLANLPGDVKIEVEKAIIGSESARIMDDSAQIVEFMGALSSMTTESWTIAGRQVTVTPQTEIKGTFSVGDRVKVHARVNADGSLTAIEIEGSAAAGNGNDNLNGNQNDNANENANINSNENENANENSNENDNANENSNDNLNENTNANSNGFDDDDKFEFKGTVQTILPDMWVIGGIKVAVSSETRIQNAISVGDYVEVYAITQPDGTLLAFKIELEDGGNSSNDNDNGDDGSRDDDSNSNDNDSDDHDDDSDDSNDNSDDRDDDDDDDDDSNDDDD